MFPYLLLPIEHRERFTNLRYVRATVSTTDTESRGAFKNARRVA